MQTATLYQFPLLLKQHLLKGVTKLIILHSTTLVPEVKICHVCRFPSQLVLLNTGKHLLRFLTFCQKNVPSDEEYDVEFDGDELFYVDPITYQVERRLSEFAQQWTPDPGLPHEVNVSLGTCQYNIPCCIVGENLGRQVA